MKAMLTALLLTATATSAHAYVLGTRGSITTFRGESPDAYNWTSVRQTGIWTDGTYIAEMYGDDIWYGYLEWGGAFNLSNASNGPSMETVKTVFRRVDGGDVNLTATVNSAASKAQYNPCITQESFGDYMVFSTKGYCDEEFEGWIMGDANFDYTFGVRFTENAPSASPSPVPLPAGGLMLLSGLGLMGWRSFRSIL